MTPKNTIRVRGRKGVHVEETAAKIIEIKVEDCKLKPIEEFKRFQGELKTITRPDMELLKESIRKSGFTAPILLWSGKDFILDGHQRLKAVMELRAEGWVVRDGVLPYVEIMADTEKEAREMVLAFNSQYGRVTSKGLRDFIGEDFEEEIGDLKGFLKIPHIDLEAMEREIRDQGSDDPEIEFAEELSEEHQYVVLYFRNEMDWLHALTVLGLKSVKPLHAKPGFQSRSVGRVIDGVTAMSKIRENR
jgi:hypothetical protein